MWGAYTVAIEWNSALRTQILIWASLYEVGHLYEVEHFNKWGQFYRLLGSKSVY